MEAFRELQQAFLPVQASFLRSKGIERVLQGRIGTEHYASYLRQVFHHTRENPQIQTLATVYFRGHQRAAIKRFFRHASSELGHDILALEDLRTLGEDVARLAEENPLPETAALIAFPFHQIYNLSPVGYLGYLFFLEFLPTGNGGALMDALERVGVEGGAMRFLRDHATIDVGHNKLMEGYAQALLKRPRELASAIYAMRVTGVLYGRMIEASFAQADHPIDYGLSAEEASLETFRHEPREEQATGERPCIRWPEQIPTLQVLRRDAS